MAVNYTTLLGLTQPVNGTEAGTWGDDVNNGVTALVDAAIAGATTFSASGTMAVTQGAANTFRQAIIIVSGNTGAITLTAPASKTKTYIVLNESAYNCTIIAGGTGTTIAAGVYATVACDGTNYYTVASSADAAAAAAAQSTANTALANAATANAAVAAETARATTAEADKVSKTATGTQSILSQLNANKNYGVVGDSAAAIRLSLNGGVGGAYLTGYAGESYYLHNAEYINGSGYVARATTASGVYLANGVISFLTNAGLTSGSTFTPTTRVTIDQSGNLGIGTSSPTSMLQVAGETYGVGGFKWGLNSASPGVAGNGGIYAVVPSTFGYGISANAPSGGLDIMANQATFGMIRFWAGTPNESPTERMRLDASGNLGIGVAPSAWDSSYKSVDNGLASYSYTTGIMGLGLNYYYDGTNFKYIQSIQASLYRQNGGQHVWYNAPSGTAGATVSFTQAMTLDASGNLLLGSAVTTGARLKVNPDANTGMEVLTGNTATNTRLVFRNASVSAFTPVEYQAISHLWFSASGGNAMTLDASGNLLVGLPSALANGKMQVAGSIGLSGNTQIRQATNSDGNTLQFLGTQFVAGPFNSISAGYSGGGLIASVATGDSGILFDAGRVASTDGRVKIINTTSGNTAFSVEKNGSYTLYASSAGSVGIGTNSPSHNLDVRGDIAAGNGTITGGISYSTRVEIGAFSNHNLGFITNNTTQMVLDTSGNLGIGVTPSAWAATKAIELIGGGHIGFASEYATIISNGYYDGAYRYKTTAVSARYGQENGVHKWYNAPSGTAGNPITFTQAMTLDASGNLLVGATSAVNSGFITLVKASGVARVSVQSTVAGNSDAALYLECSGTNAGEVIYKRATSTLAFSNGGVTGMSLDTSGNLTVTGTVTATNLLGQGQTYTDVTASRAASTTYTNSTARPIRVEIILVGTGTNQGTITAGGLTTGQIVGATGATRQYSFIILPGATYNATVTGTIQKWFELR